MITDLHGTGGWRNEGAPDRAGSSRRRSPAAPAAPGHVVVEGPGGTGKSLLLAEVVAGYRAAGLTVVGLAVDDQPNVAAGSVAVVVDDAHRLPDEAILRVRRLVDDGGCRVALAFRPWPSSPALAELVRALGTDGRAVVLGHVDRGTVQDWARDEIGGPLPPGLVDAVVHQTGGLPALVRPLLRCLASPHAVSRSTGRLLVPDEVLDVVRAQLGTLDEDTRSLMHAVAAGAPLETEVLADLLAVPPSRIAELLGAARSSGLLLGNGDLVPLAARGLGDLAAPELTRDTRRRLLGLLVERGDQPLELARMLAADRVRDLRAARLLERQGDAALRSDPATAPELLDAAMACGASVHGIAARRAQAAALAGDFDAALRWADTVLTDDDAPDRSRAAGVAATVLAHRGLPGHSAELYRLAGAQRTGAVALALLSTGAASEACAALDGRREAATAEPPTLLSGCEELMARGVLQSLRTGENAGADIAAALSTLSRAASLLEPVGRSALLQETPAALAALVALHCGELGVTESVLDRAVAADTGGAPSRARHLLLLAWAAMLRGRMNRAREYLVRAQDPEHGLEPRDDLYLQALDVGLARRSGDAPGLAAAWARAREALLRYPIDLFSLLPLGELMIAGARLGESDRIAPNVAAAQALLDRLGSPDLWAAPLHWSGAQAAILVDDPAGLRPHAAALVAAARTSPYAANLARAGRCWLRVLTGDIDAEIVESTAQDLAAVGLTWDGSRLAGQAAARTRDPRARTALLSCARVLAETHDLDTARPMGRPDGASSPPSPAGRLSEREREVARLVVAGQTYREIGGTLFISAKTVEHHVSRIRQRLGASNRSDLLARLRLEIAQSG
ncbi:LuxR C-terminal-related transcriptional regulator [Blastococcus sp. SYSU DS0617]